MNYQTAMRQLMNKPFCGSPKFREQQGRANRKGGYIDPVTGDVPIVEFEKAFVRELRRRGIPFFAHNMVRTAEEQDALKVAGVSRAGAGFSPHNYGMAVDLIHSIHGWELDRHSWQIIGHIGKEVAERLKIPIRWGGDWDDDGQIVLDDPNESLWDPAHWELADWRELAGL